MAMYVGDYVCDYTCDCLAVRNVSYFQSVKIVQSEQYLHVAMRGNHRMNGQPIRGPQSV